MRSCSRPDTQLSIGTITIIDPHLLGFGMRRQAAADLAEEALGRFTKTDGPESSPE